MVLLRFSVQCAALLVLLGPASADPPVYEPVNITNYGNVRSVSVGRDGVWAVRSQNIYYKVGSRCNSLERGDNLWVQVHGSALKVDVGEGEGVWAIASSGGRTLSRHGITDESPTGNSWSRVDVSQPGFLKHVSMSPSGKIWGVNSRNKKAYYRRGVADQAPLGTGWTAISGPERLKHIDAGHSGVWGVLIDGTVVYRNLTYADGISSNPRGNAWIRVPNSRPMKEVYSCYYMIVGRNVARKLFLRTGVTPTNPLGTGWSLLDRQRVKTVDCYGRTIWGVYSNGALFTHSRLQFHVTD